jgi:hypothetical protein
VGPIDWTILTPIATKNKPSRDVIEGRNSKKKSRLSMDSRMVNQIEEFYRQDAKFTERKEESLQEKFQDNLVSLSVDPLRTWRLGGKILRFAENRFITLESIKSQNQSHVGQIFTSFGKNDNGERRHWTGPSSA